MSTVTIPGLAGLKDAAGVFKKQVKGTDVLVGAVVGLAGVVVLKKAKEMIGADKVPSFVERFSPALAGVRAGAGLYFAQKNKARASGHAVGAVAAGLAAQAAVELKARFPQYFADVVDLRLSGIIINDPVARMNGLVIDDPAPGLAGYADNAGLNSLAALSMAVDADDYDGFGELLN